MKVAQELLAYGHPNILAKHPTTFEITKASDLTRRGDCVIGVKATKGPRDLSLELRGLCMKSESTILVELEAGGMTEVIEGRGSPNLTLRHSTEMVGRKSSFASDRTIMVRADRAACDLDRDFVKALSSPATKLRVRITVEL